MSRTRSSVPGQRRPALHRGRVTLDPPGLFPLKLARLMDHEVKEVSDFALPIEENTSAALRRAVAHRAEDLVLPRTLVALEDLFGACPWRSDAWKCTFSFPLLVTADAPTSTLRYLMIVGDCRGSIDVLFYRLQDEPVPGLNGYHAPFDRELSRQQLDYLTDYLLRFLMERSDAAVPHIESFYRVVGSERIVYGKRGGRLFESWSAGKFPSVTDERAVTKGEVLALATRAGIRAAKARLVHSDGVPVALIRRFDRAGSAGRTMYVSAATLMGVDAFEHQALRRR